jgi:hypothetical protein
VGDVGHVQLGVVQHSHMPVEHAQMFYVDGGMKVSEGSTVVLFVGDVKFLACSSTEMQCLGHIELLSLQWYQQHGSFFSTSQRGHIYILLS